MIRLWPRRRTTPVVALTPASRPAAAPPAPAPLRPVEPRPPRPVLVDPGMWEVQPLIHPDADPFLTGLCPEGDLTLPGPARATDVLDTPGVTDSPCGPVRTDTSWRRA